MSAVVAAVALVLAACGSSADSADDDAGSGGSGEFPVTIKHAFGETTIEKKPERVATVAWSNHEVPLALGVVPVGMQRTTYGDDDKDGLHPWVKDRLDELGADTPVLFDEADGIDFEAVADAQPDVILAAYSGLTQEEYDTLSKIAPVVAYPDTPWGTTWRQTIEMNSAALGLADEGQKLIEELETTIADGVAEYPQLKDKTAMFVYVEPSDLSSIGVYTTKDARAAYMEDLGLAMPKAVLENSKDAKNFFFEQSAEEIDAFDDADILIGYGGDNHELLNLLRSDPLLSKLPAVERGSVAEFVDGTPLASAGTPTALSIPWALDDYLATLAEAADKVQ